MFNYIKRIKSLYKKINSFDQKLHSIQEALGRIEIRQNHGIIPLRLSEQEFQVFSQWGEDGIIQFLISHVKIENSFFVEFGVENYLEANTRFLMINNNWSGLVIDGNPDNIAYKVRYLLAS